MKLLPAKPTVTLEEVNRLDVRVGTIERVDDVDGSRKLVRLSVNFGDFSRSILVGMKGEHVAPDEVVPERIARVVGMDNHQDIRQQDDARAASPRHPLLSRPKSRS